MKKLLTFASVIALAVAFGLAGAANAGRPEGVGGGPPGGGTSESVSYFSSPLIALGICDLDNESPSYHTCISGKNGMCLSDAECDDVEVTSRVEINSRGDWSVMTEALPQDTDVQICLDAESGPSGELLPLLLRDSNTGGAGQLNDFGGYTANDGHWRGPRFQIRADDDIDCDGDILQESGISLDGLGVSKLSAPFVALVYDENGVVTVIGEVESTAQIDRNGNWILYTTGLQRKQRYDICLVGMHDGLDEVPPLFLSDLTSQPSGKLYAKGNAVDYGGGGIWTEVRFQIRIEPEDYWPNCDKPPVQESGITIDGP